MESKRYIGDGVYVEDDGFQLVLTTEDGMSATNTIYLDSHVWQNLQDYVAEVREGNV